MRGLVLCLLVVAAIAARPFTAVDLHKTIRVGSPVVSPNGDIAVYTIRSWNEATNKASVSLESVVVNTSTTAKLTKANSLTTSESQPVFSPDGGIVAFLGDDSTLIYQVVVKTGQVSVLAKLPVPVSSFKFAPNGKMIVFVAKVYIDCADPLPCTAARNAEVAARGANTYQKYTQLYVRHWDTWETEGQYNHLFALPVARGVDGTFTVAGNAYDLTYRMAVAAPVPPFGGSEQYDISPDGLEVAFTGEVIEHSTAFKTGWRIYTVSTIPGSLPNWITSFTNARCQDPLYSRDGRFLAYLAMDRPGLESDKLHLNVVDRSRGLTNNVGPRWDRSIGGYTWGFDGDSFIIDGNDDGHNKMFHYRVSTGALTPIMNSGHNSGAQIVPGTNMVLFARNNMMAPADIWQFSLSADMAHGFKQLTNYNRQLLSEVFMSTPEVFYFPSNGSMVHGILLRPYNFNPNGKYPLAQLIHGGPEGMFGDDWSYRWNAQLWASAGYVTIMINPAGSSGFGMDFQEAVRYDWGGRPFRDLMAGNDYVVSRYSFVDKNRMCAAGASYGGYMINWINGHDHRFKCLVNHNGVFSNMGMYYSSEEVFFSEAEFGPPPHESAEARAMVERFSPVNHVSNWRTPALVIVGGRDFRIPEAEGLSTFTALQRKNIPSKLLYFPLENHWVLNSANSIEWYKEVLGWMDRWTKA